MTNNQINYARLREDTRHNFVSERTERHKAGSSRIQALSSMFGLQETATHNRATEQLGRDQLSESIRHNSATETQSINELAERKRANQASEAETARTNRANEAIRDFTAQSQHRIGMENATSNRLQAEASYRQSSAALSQASTATARLIEDSRHNLVSEGLQSRSINNDYSINLGRNQENYRSNVNREAETARHNKAEEENIAKQRTATYSTEMEKVHVSQDRNKIEAWKGGTALAQSILRLGGLF